MDATSQTGMGPWHIPTTTQHGTTAPAHHNHTPPGLGDGRTAHLPLFRKELASALWPCAHFQLPVSLSPRSGRLSKMRAAPGAFPSELSPIKTGLPSFSATLTSTDTLPTITEYCRTRTEESLKRVAPVPDMASGPCCEAEMVNGRRSDDLERKTGKPPPPTSIPCTLQPVLFPVSRCAALTQYSN